MKKSKKLIALLSVVLVAGTVIFTACKKDKDDDSVGTKAANELCDCVTKAGENPLSALICLDNLQKNYSNYIVIDETSEEYFVVKDQTFAKDFEASINNCKAMEDFLGY